MTGTRSLRHRERSVAIQGRAEGICHAALDCHGAPRLAMTANALFTSCYVV